MAEMSRKRKICCGLSSCCGKTRSESAQMIAGKSSTQPLTRTQKCSNCCCWPFRKIGNAFKRRKVDSTESMQDMKPSLWERMCCCSSCCRRCKKGDDMEKMKKVSSGSRTCGQSDRQPQALMQLTYTLRLRLSCECNLGADLNCD